MQLKIIDSYNIKYMLCYFPYSEKEWYLNIELMTLVKLAWMAKQTKQCSIYVSRIQQIYT